MITVEFTRRQYELTLSALTDAMYLESGYMREARDRCDTFAEMLHLTALKQYRECFDALQGAAC